MMLRAAPLRLGRKSLLAQTRRCLSANLKAEIEAEISSNPIVIYSKSFCPFCSQTKAMFAALETQPAPLIHELDLLKDGAERQQVLQQISGQRTVPNIFIGGEHLGGNSDLCDLAQDGSLADMLDQAKVSYKH
mmetsp:Transcript_23397/g.27439  ORF Transcript_23397/g.27439 Transcript_23397/m.27439 type:complete len:133 (+) Transcript_23397:18-416(+)